MLGEYHFQSVYDSFDSNVIVYRQTVIKSSCAHFFHLYTLQRPQWGLNSGPISIGKHLNMLISEYSIVLTAFLEVEKSSNPSVWL